MKITKCLKHAFEMVVHSKLRSWLTILGIVIGVASVIAIVSISDGLKASVNSQLSGLGGDIITLTPGASRGGNMFGPPDGGGSRGGASASQKVVTLTKTDSQVIRAMPDIALFDTQIKGNVKVSYLGRNGSVSLTGVDQKVWSLVTTSKIAQGRFLDSADQNVIVIGGRLASSYFSQPLGINQVISISGSSFRVVGILDDESNSIYMPIAMAYQVLEDKTKDNYDSIVIKVADENNLNYTMNELDSRLMLSRHVTVNTKDFSIVSSKQIAATRTQMLTSITAFLIAIAAVSLIVGAVGVANTMFTSVLEKTKEIGIMKAIGAMNRDIMLIFLFNSALIGLVGGIIGIIFGGILSGFMPALMGTSLPTRGGLTTIVSLSSVIMALCVSVGSGIIAGLIPAYQASKLKPVDALRYE